VVGPSLDSLNATGSRDPGRVRVGAGCLLSQG